jgi:hypothetical protein
MILAWNGLLSKQCRILLTEVKRKQNIGSHFPAQWRHLLYIMFKYPVVLEDWRHYKPNDVEGMVKYNFEIILSSNLEKL